MLVFRSAAFGAFALACVTVSNPANARYLESDPIGQAAGPSTYGYVRQSPLVGVDPNGLDAIEIRYKYYSVNTGLGFHLPLGHGGVVSVDPAKGTTRYYEFGRYTDKECGNVRSQPVPNLKMGKDGLPTQDSLDKLYAFLSTNYGHGSEVEATYYPDSDYAATIDYAEQFKAKHECYALIGNNCKTFAHDAAVACGEGQTCK